jgi:hypothetical protein
MGQIERLYVSEEMLNTIKSDRDFFQVISSSHLICENELVYDRIMNYFGQLHIGAFGNREQLTITA